jgi:enoyl-CoA hydratase
VSTIASAVEDRVLTVVLDRPERRNALTTELLRELADAVTAADAADHVDVVVITGADPAFCAGVDLAELEATGRPPDFTTPLPSISKPVVGAINGAAVTGGLELALACDLLIASERARFADTHAPLGLLPGWGQTARLPQAVGTRRALEMLLTGRFIDAEVALRIGLVTEVVPHGELVSRAQDLARAIANADQPAVRATLALVRDTAGAPLASALEREREAFAAWQGGGIDTHGLAQARASSAPGRGAVSGEP